MPGHKSISVRIREISLVHQALLAVLPAILTLLVFEVFLGHRHDYAGHYAAGYGATLVGLMIWLRVLSPHRYPRFSTYSIAPLCLGAIFAGIVTEATVFRIAKFDEVDFCNQSLGAVLAGIVAVAYSKNAKPPLLLLDVGLIIGIMFLGVGGCLAVA